jgi:hypothetical protein
MKSQTGPIRRSLDMQMQFGLRQARNEILYMSSANIRILLWFAVC